MSPSCPSWGWLFLCWGCFIWSPTGRVSLSGPVKHPVHLPPEGHSRCPGQGRRVTGGQLRDRTQPGQAVAPHSEELSDAAAGIPSTGRASVAVPWCRSCRASGPGLCPSDSPAVARQVSGCVSLGLLVHGRSSRCSLQECEEQSRAGVRPADSSGSFPVTALPAGLVSAAG